MEVELERVVSNYQGYDFIETVNSKVCPFCKNDTVFSSSSWSNEECFSCGATYIIDGWWRDGDQI